MKTRREIGKEICDAMNNDHYDGIENTEGLKDIVDYCYELQQVKNNSVLSHVSETYTADQMRKMFFAGLFHDTVVDESEDGEAYETAYNDVMSRAKQSSR